MTATREDLLRDYRAAFLRHLARREESALNAGYEIGRAALAAGLSLLDVVRVHHDVLIEVLRNGPAEEVPLVAGAASDFLLEVLASYDMAQRGFPRPG
jgi:S-adenosylmethionine:diacylglycerol 3-amino-3-carboxypropyl transferase